MKIRYKIIPKGDDQYKCVRFIGDRIAQEQPDYFKVLNDKVALIREDKLYGLFDMETFEITTPMEYDKVEIEPYADGVALVHMFKGINYWTVDVRKKDLTPKLNPNYCEEQLKMLENNPLLYKNIKDAYIESEVQQKVFYDAIENGISKYKDKALYFGEDLDAISDMARKMRTTFKDRNSNIQNPNEEEFFVYNNYIPDEKTK